MVSIICTRNEGAGIKDALVVSLQSLNFGLLGRKRGKYLKQT